MTVEYKSGIHPNRRNGTNWSTDYFPSMQKWDFAAPCSVICKSDGYQLKEEKKVVTVYNRELNITSPPEKLEVNKTYSLECIGPRVYPNNKLILTWLRGREIVQRNFTGEEGFPDEDKRLRNIFNFTASMSDNGQEYTCLAEVDLGSNTTKPITNSSVTLQTYYRPRDTTISVNDKKVSGFPVYISEGDEVTITCNSKGNPKPTFQWDVPRNGNSVETGPPGILHISHTTSEHQGIYKCIVANQYGNDEKEVNLRVKGEVSARSLAAMYTGLSSVAIVAAALLATMIVCFRNMEKEKK
ncbi:vascular cell adhesion protein 1-like isoform X2 [Heterodontus francisci]